MLIRTRQENFYLLATIPALANTSDGILTGHVLGPNHYNKRFSWRKNAIKFEISKTSLSNWRARLILIKGLAVMPQITTYQPPNQALLDKVL